jgi:uncharacterized repeat protein (TIGR03803 family)
MLSNVKVSFAPAVAQVLVVALVLLVSGFIQPANAQTIHDLYDFSSTGNGDYLNGALPFAGLVHDRRGNLYGTTLGGGAFAYGTVFKLTPSDSETVLHSFTFNGPEGWEPEGDLVLDDEGNLYGTTYYGGYFGGIDGIDGYGTVFEVDASGNETVLHTFVDTDGAFPQAGLIRDWEGNLYGTTVGGGSSGEGTVFKLSPSGKFTVLHNFTSGSRDGQNPAGPLLLDDGNLYGTTFTGGTEGSGTIFKLERDGHETILHNFNAVIDGAFPETRLIRDRAGNLYGTTGFYGPSSTSGAQTVGTVFKLDRDGKLNVLYTFVQSPKEGYSPEGLVMDRAGNLFGTTGEGGTANRGILYKIDREGKETILYNFGSDSSHPALEYPMGNLIMDWKGNIYGVCAGFNTDTEGGIFMFGADPDQRH